MSAAACAACSPSGATTDAAPNDCTVGLLGDGGAPDFEFLALQPGAGVAALADGGTMPILVPPQGDQYIFPGVRATNLDGCQLLLVASLRDLSTQHIATEHRYINLVPTGDGWGASGVAGQSVAVQAASFANVQVCPDFWSSTDVYGHEYGLEMMIQDREGRQLEKKIHVTPECAEPETRAACLCVCRAGYVLGQSCDGGGADDGGPADATSGP